jgi:autotransporter strand-loop-strand O-heptosyltransferase
MWTKANRKFYTDWRVQITDVKSGKMIVNEPIVLKDRKVYISLDSSSLGDSLAWFPAVEEFRKKHGCKVICSTHMNYMFKDQYPEIEFVNPGEVVNDIVAMYNIGWYYDDQNKIDLSRNLREVKDQPMQKCAFDILGLAHQETRPLIKIPQVEKKKKITIGIHGTCQAKYWNNPTGWQEVADWCNQHGYEVVLLSREEDGFMGNSHPTGVRKLEAGPLSTVIQELEESQVFRLF